MKRLLILLLPLLTFVSCEDFSSLFNGSDNKMNYQLIHNIPNSNWESIIILSEDDAFCINVDANQQSELLAIINNDTDIRMKFDELTRPISFTIDKLEVDIIYTDGALNLISTIDGISDVKTYPIPNVLRTRASGEDAIMFTAEVVKSQTVDYVMDIIDGVIENKLGYPILGIFDEFVNMVNTLRDLDNIRDGVELVDYLETESDIRKFIDLIRKRPTHKEDDSTTYIIGITAGSAQVSDNIATLELLGTIIGSSKGKDLDFEYGLCYSKSNSTPNYTDNKVGTTFMGMSGQTYIEIALPHPFPTERLENGDYYYRGYFRDNDTGNIIYSDNVQSFTITYKPMTLNSISYEGDYYCCEQDGTSYIAYNCTANISGNTTVIENFSSCGIYIHESDTGDNYKWYENVSGNYNNEDIDFFIGINISNFENIDYARYYAESTNYSFGVYVEFNDGTYYLSEPKTCAFVYNRTPAYKYLSVGSTSVSVIDSYEDEIQYSATHSYSYAIDGALWIEYIQGIMEGGNWQFTDTGGQYGEPWSPSWDWKYDSTRTNTYWSGSDMSHIVYNKIVTKGGKTEYSNSLVYGGTPENPTVSIGGVRTSSAIEKYHSKVYNSKAKTTSCGYSDGMAISDIEINKVMTIDDLKKIPTNKVIH